MTASDYSTPNVAATPRSIKQVVANVVLQTDAEMGESFPVDIRVNGNVGGKEEQNREELEAKWKKEWESIEAKMRE